MRLSAESNSTCASRQNSTTASDVILKKNFERRTPCLPSYLESH